jgi:hypothetical protein
MARGRRPEDWVRDLDGARAAEAALAAILEADLRLEGFRDNTHNFDVLDFFFSYEGGDVQLDLKEKINPTSGGLAALWTQVPRQHIFVVDETVYRRIVWHGGGGYLVVHDHPGSRWVYFGPWELTLGPRVRYVRWGRLKKDSFPKGKVMLDLRAGAAETNVFEVDALLDVIERSRRERDAVGAVEIRGHPVPEIGGGEAPDQQLPGLG